MSILNNIVYVSGSHLVEHQSGECQVMSASVAFLVRVTQKPLRDESASTLEAERPCQGRKQRQIA